MSRAYAWTVAGSDSSGGAGITADMLTFQHLNVHGCTIITAVTSQDAHQVHAIHPIPPEHLQIQFDTLHHAYPPNAIKIGMLGNPFAIEILKSYLMTYTGKVVLDPVLISTSGQSLFNTNKNNYIRQLTALFPFIDLITPNLPEAEALLSRKISSYDDMKDAAQAFLSLGVKSVVIKGGHFEHDIRCHDYWTNGSESFWLSCPRYETKNYRGSGCVFSSAVTAALATGHELQDSLVIAKMYINRGIRLADHQSSETAFIHHSTFPEDEEDLPYLLNMPSQEPRLKFYSCVPERIGLYPVVDNSDWLKRLLPLGIKTIQLRIKNKQGDELENEIKQAIFLARQYNAKLFINDYWELAIKHGAYGVHLGQEDLTTADIKKIHAAGLRLGISTHCFHEAARAHAFHPSYMACGPIFPTNSKIMPFDPQGIEKLHYWKRLLRHYSIVAIGGINEDNMTDVVNTEVDGVAMISAILHDRHPEQKARSLLEKMDKQK